jgi:hypothetical protein
VRVYFLPQIICGCGTTPRIVEQHLANEGRIVIACQHPACAEAGKPKIVALPVLSALNAELVDGEYRHHVPRARNEAKL